MTTVREKPVCASCGSDDVVFDGPVAWSVELNAWESCGHSYDKSMHCNGCDEDGGRPDWIPVPTSPETASPASS